MEHSEASATSAAERYLLDEMPPDERQAFEEHFFDCAECAADVRDEAMIVAAVRSGRQAADNVVAMPRPSRAGWLAAAAAVAGMSWLGYVNLALHSQLAAAMRPRVLHSYSLMTAGTRGAEPIVIEHAGEPSELVFDVQSTPPFPRYRLELRDASGRAFAPPVDVEGQQTVSFYVPAGLLKPGNYTLVTDGIAGSRKQPGVMTVPIVVRSN
jgi:hypothetical protein